MRLVVESAEVEEALHRLERRDAGTAEDARVLAYKVLVAASARFFRVETVFGTLPKKVIV